MSMHFQKEFLILLMYANCTHLILYLDLRLPAFNLIFALDCAFLKLYTCYVLSYQTLTKKLISINFILENIWKLMSNNHAIKNYK